MPVKDARDLQRRSHHDRSGMVRAVALDSTSALSTRAASLTRGGSRRRGGELPVAETRVHWSAIFGDLASNVRFQEVVIVT